MVEVNCDYCGHSINKTPSMIKKQKYCFCNMICRRKFEKKHGGLNRQFYIDKEKLRNLYKNHTILDIARMKDTSCATISRRLDEYCLRKRLHHRYTKFTSVGSFDMGWLCGTIMGMEIFTKDVLL